MRQLGFTSEQEVRAVLEERALAYARRPAVDAPAAAFDAVRFRFGAESYALDVRFVQRVAAAPTVTRVPGAPPIFAGVSVMRGVLLPIVDLALLMDVAPPAALPFAIVLGRGRPDVAILTGAVDDLRIPQAAGASLSAQGARSSLVARVLPDGCTLLDGAALLDDPRLLLVDVPPLTKERPG